MESIISDDLSHPECCYVDTAFGSVQNRNIVKKITEIVLPCNPVDCFRSIFRFGLGFKEHVERTASVREFKPSRCYTDHLWFDLDDSNLDRAKESAAELLFHLENEYDLLPQMVMLYFSGQKGFHIGIPAGHFGWEPSPDLPRIVKRIAVKLAHERPVDLQIYDTVRLLRLCGSLHSGSGRYKVRLDPARFQNGMSADEIVQLARKNQSFVPRDEPSIELNGNLNEVYVAAKQELAGKTRKSQVGVKKQPDAQKPCIQALLRGVGKGVRNDAAIRLAVYFRKLGISQAGTLTELLAWNCSNQSPLAEHEVKQTVQSAYSDNAEYNYGCDDPLLASVCDESCKIKGRQQASKEDDPIRTSFEALPDGSIIEMLYCPDRKPQTFFVKYEDGQIEYVDRTLHPTTGKLILPFKANKIIDKGTVLFPSEATEFGSTNKLLGEVRDYISRYLRVSPFYLKLASYYVLLSWVYDNYNVLPYLRALGGWGTGKSRFLQTIGLACYKPIITGGAATVSPIFRLIDQYGGTLVIDEADFPQSDDSAMIVKILNCGYQKGCPVLRSGPKQNNFEPESFDVYGPKLIASRHEFRDRALESRCLTEMMDGCFEQDSVPINLPDSFHREALLLRNKLLMFRLKNYGKTKMGDYISRLCIEPRLAQVLEPIAGIIQDGEEKAALIEFARERNRQIIDEKGESLEGKVALVVIELWEDESKCDITMKMIGDEVNEKHLANAKYKITPRKVGSIIKNKFSLSTTRKGSGVNLNLDVDNQKKLEVVARRYGVEYNVSPQQRSLHTQRSSGVVGQGVTP